MEFSQREGNSKVEILAPAGSEESVRAAVRCGANAVYLGLQGLNARRGAKNFDEEALRRTASFCHERGVKIHLTLNTLVFDREMEEAKSVIGTACACALDGVIVQDLAVLRLLRECAPALPIHASTQMSVHSLEGVLQLAEMGFSRAVLARELSRPEIEHICKHSPIEIELFVHGALCMSMSGQCTLSAMAGGRSGNRGMCAQPCRQKITCALKGAKPDNGYALSLRDMSLLTHEYMEQLRRAGVASLKIEGRMKRPEYVAAAVTAAREALKGKTPDWQALQSAFSRGGFTDGYYTGHLERSMFGVRRQEDVRATKEALPALQRLGQGEYSGVPVSMELSLRAGERASLTVRDRDGHTAVVRGDTPQPAQSRPTTREDACKALGKLGGTYYTIGDISTEIDDKLMIPLSSLSALRRQALQELSAQRQQLAPIPFQDWAPSLPRHRAKSGPALRVCALSAGQVTPGLLGLSALCALPPRALRALLDSPLGQENLHKLAVRQPVVGFDDAALCRELGALRELGVDKLLVSGLAGVRLGKALGFTLIGDASLNITNSQALEEYRALGVEESTLSFELMAPRIAGLRGEAARGIVAYGRLPLMTMRACPLRGTLGCRRCREQGGALRDRQGRTFPVCCAMGASQLYNSETLYLADRMGEIQNIDFYWLSYTFESGAEALQIAREYAGEAPAQKRGSVTRGLYFRKVL